MCSAKLNANLLPPRDVHRSCTQAIPTIAVEKQRRTKPKSPRRICLVFRFFFEEFSPELAIAKSTLPYSMVYQAFCKRARLRTCMERKGNGVAVTEPQRTEGVEGEANLPCGVPCPCFLTNKHVDKYFPPPLFVDGIPTTLYTCTFCAFLLLVSCVPLRRLPQHHHTCDMGRGTRVFTVGFLPDKAVSQR